MTNYKQKALDHVRKACPELMELSMGCRIENLFFYKTEADKKKNNIDWTHLDHHEDGLRGTVVKDLRKSDLLPMWVDWGDQLEFQVEANDIVSFDIIGHTPHLEHWFRGFQKAPLNTEIAPNINGLIYSNNAVVCEYNLTLDGENQSEDFYKAYCEIVGI